MTDYPYAEGETIVLGPEVFAAKDKTTISWRGENYYTEERWWELFGEKIGARKAEEYPEGNGPHGV